MASEMVEKVAMAIWDDCCPGMEWGDEDKKYYMRMAQAAIIALREPTEAMWIDSDMSDRRRWNCHTCGGPRENWERMIDAALSDD